MNVRANSRYPFCNCENLNLNSDLILFLFPDRTDDERFVQKKKKTKEEISSIMINDLLKMKLITNSDSSSSCNHFHFSLPTRLVSWKNS